MELWIPLTIAAAFLQNVRSLLQKQLTAKLSTNGASYCRFVFALPFAVAYYLLVASRMDMPAPHSVFLLYCLIGGVAQILGTVFLIASFSYRNFAVGTAYSKTESVQAALFGIVLLGEAVAPLSFVAIVLSLAGVVIMTLRDGSVSPLAMFTSPAGLYGIASGATFAIAAVSYRAASVSLGHESFIAASATTLLCVLFIQTSLMGLWLLWRETGQLSKVAGQWQQAILVGLTGMLASAGWFAAMTLQNAAYVRALGQIELLFTFLTSLLLFRERSTLPEVLGISLLISGILLLLLA